MNLHFRTPFHRFVPICITPQNQVILSKSGSYIDSIDDYDTIYLGYPNYWGTMPMAVFTFLEGFDFSGKTVRPFCTHEGSGLGSSVSDLRRICPNATIGKGLDIVGSTVNSARPKADKWVNS